MGATDPTAVNPKQLFWIQGTGDLEHGRDYTVIMDFWREDAVGFNHVCLEPSARQDKFGAGQCVTNTQVTADGAKICLNAA